MTPTDIEALERDVRMYVFTTTAATARVPQPPEISTALKRTEDEIAIPAKRWWDNIGFT